ncbi:MAG: hypothetical protein RQ760_05770 [Sedimentisphaerales bacterium]|nr:hypothetical protein [Sedimentisphaerales bacterium]
MKISAVVFRILLFIFLLAAAGCGQLMGRSGRTSNADDLNKLSAYSRFAPDRINIMPLTEFFNTGNVRQISIKPYVSLIDSFGSQIKSPGIFRFELYQRALRSAEPKGKRAVIWQDIDLTEPAVNHEYWRDFLRAYEFDLPFELDVNQSYILQVTCQCLNGRRLSAEFALKLTQ